MQTPNFSCASPILAAADLGRVCLTVLVQADTVNATHIVGIVPVITIFTCQMLRQVMIRTALGRQACLDAVRAAGGMLPSTSYATAPQAGAARCSLATQSTAAGSHMSDQLSAARGLALLHYNQTWPHHQTWASQHQQQRGLLGTPQKARPVNYQNHYPDKNRASYKLKTPSCVIGELFSLSSG